jgi:hypothetical protein
VTIRLKQHRVAQRQDDRSDDHLLVPADTNPGNGLFGNAGLGSIDPNNITKVDSARLINLKQMTRRP